MTAVLQVQDIHTYYDTSHILQGVSLEVGEGRIVCVLGRNGVGKTTLIRSIVGTTPPRQGRIFYRGAELTGLPPHIVTRKGIALVPQGRRIFASLTVRENLELGIRRDGSGAASRWTLDRIFEIFPILHERERQAGNALSGGEQQMLACGRALLSNPSLLLMDEPSEGLAPQKLRELGEVMAELKRGGLSVLLVEQKLSFAIRYADHVYALAKGQIAFDGPPQALVGDRALLERLLGVAPS
jgi:branched-chain amino acid transport system ATP-binding protein